MFGQNAVCLELKINAGRKKVSLVSSYFMSLFSMTADTGFYEVPLHYPLTSVVFIVGERTLIMNAPRVVGGQANAVNCVMGRGVWTNFQPA